MTEAAADGARLIEGNNLIFGDLVDVPDDNSEITFEGENNVLFIQSRPGGAVRVLESSIRFHGSNSLVFLGPNWNPYKLDLGIWNDSVFFCAGNLYCNGPVSTLVSEQTNVLVGDNCLFARDIWLRTADPHLLYDVDTHERINPSRSIVIGDHVWLGQQAIVLKGSHIGSGAVVGAASVVAGKQVPSNTAWGGNPARELRRGVYFRNDVVHSWREQQTAAHARDDRGEFVYSHAPEITWDFAGLDAELRALDSPLAKLEFLLQFSQLPKEHRLFLG